MRLTGVVYLIYVHTNVRIYIYIYTNLYIYIDTVLSLYKNEKKRDDILYYTVKITLYDKKGVFSLLVYV